MYSWEHMFLERTGLDVQLCTYVSREDWSGCTAGNTYTVSREDCSGRTAVYTCF